MPPDQPSTPSLPETHKPPRCAMCRTRMELVRSQPATGGAMACTYTCPKCEFVKTKTVGGDAPLDRNLARRRPKAKAKAAK